MLPDEVRKAVEYLDDLILNYHNFDLLKWQTIRAHLLAREAEVERLRDDMEREQGVREDDELEGVVKFLLGEGELNGRWFGDEPPVTASGLKRRYWWRDDLRKAHATLADMAKRLEAAERDARRWRFVRAKIALGDASVFAAMNDAIPDNAPDEGPVIEGMLDDGVDAAIDATQEGAG